MPLRLGFVHTQYAQNDGLAIEIVTAAKDLMATEIT